jgi:hypothetical protein
MSKNRSGPAFEPLKQRDPGLQRNRRDTGVRAGRTNLKNAVWGHTAYKILAEITEFVGPVPSPGTRSKFANLGSIYDFFPILILFMSWVNNYKTI